MGNTYGLLKGVGHGMRQSVPNRGNCATHPRSYQQGHVARAREREQGQEEMGQRTGSEGQGKDPDMILRD